MICRCLETECHCTPDDALIWQGRWRCPRCDVVVKLKFRRSHRAICAWRQRLVRTEILR